ncbi:hypothetical protein SARC_14313, partial [Sphaeroforma arctica JP610]
MKLLQEFECGTYSWKLKKKLNQSTHGWEVFVVAVAGSDISLIDDVRFDMHPTLVPPSV